MPRVGFLCVVEPRFIPTQKWSPRFSFFFDPRCMCRSGSFAFAFCVDPDLTQVDELRPETRTIFLPHTGAKLLGAQAAPSIQQHTTHNARRTLSVNSRSRVGGVVVLRFEILRVQA